jgi:hypothetical protein
MKQEDVAQQQQRDVAPVAAEPAAPLTEQLGFGVGTFLVAGLVDACAHFGLTGLVVGGIVAYAASQHGPELLEQVKGALPQRPSSPRAEGPRTLAAHGGKRSILDRTLGWFPADEDTSLDDAETLVVEELEQAPRASSRAFRPSFAAQVVRHPICLAPDLTLEANDIVGAGINIFGVKGSGKTGAVARLAEQFARYRVSQVLFDIKGDLVSLVTDRRPDGRPFVPNGHTGYQGHAPRGRSVLASGGQVVYDLRTWQTPEQMASLICVVIEEMLETVALTPEGELAPCLVFLDQAEYWLPQAQPSYLSGRTYKRLLDAFHMLATMGRSRGLAPVIATQRIAKVNKDIIAQAEMNVLMKAVLDIDLDRYYDYFNKSLATRERIRGFAAGEAIVCLPDGSQTITRLLERESLHLSHTPHITAALTKFAGMAERRGPLSLELDVDEAAERAMPSADQSIRRVTAPPQAVPRASGEYTMPPLSASRPARARLTPELERAFAAWNEGATSVEKLEKALSITHHQAYKLYRQLRELRVI